MQEEIYETIDAVDQATDFGAKFISDNQVVLGGFEKAKIELSQIQDLFIQSRGASSIAAAYGAYIMRDLGIFNTVRVINPKELSASEFKDVRYGGFLTLSQSGNDEHLISGLRLAYKSNLTCFNVVNSENSPITNVVDQIQKEEREAELKEKATVLYDSSDEEEQAGLFTDKNIGFYQKSGNCYSDVKSFIPQVVCMALVSLWFSDKKQSQQLQSIKQKQDTVDKRK
mmetsp:Transcript_10296/g.15729  ORF Transcript_10296/g.15729 Transcript_10296/m.15729 type:complete len:227 (+) Transcript_10296:1094-1774(+)